MCIDLERFHKCCTHRATAGQSRRSFFKPGKRRWVCGQRCLQRVSVIGVPDGLSDGEDVVARFFLIKYQSIVASTSEISFARQFSRVSLKNRTEINFARQFFGTGLFIIAVQQNFGDTLAKCSEADPRRDSKCAILPSLFWRGEGNQFLEARVVAQWLKHWIESEQCRGERRVCGQRRLVRDRKQLGQGRDGAVGVADAGRHPGEDVERPGT